MNGEPQDRVDTARKDCLAAVFALAVVTPFAFTIGQIYVDPFDPGFSARDFPIWVVSLIVLFSALLLTRTFLALRNMAVRDLFQMADGAVIVTRGLPLLVIALGYIWMTIAFQYLVATIVTTAAVVALFGNRGWRRLVLVPVLLALGCYVLFFELLNLYEPDGTILNVPFPDLL